MSLNMCKWIWRNRSISLHHLLPLQSFEKCCGVFSSPGGSQCKDQPGAKASTEFSGAGLVLTPWVKPMLPLIELDDGKIYRKALYLMAKTMVSCRFSLKSIQWELGWVNMNLSVMWHDQNPSKNHRDSTDVCEISLKNHLGGRIGYIFG